MSLSQIETLGSMEISLQSGKLNAVHWETQCECLIFAVPNTTDFWSSLLLPSMALCRGLHSTSSAYCNTLQEFNKTSFRIHARAKFNGPSAECHTRLLEAPFYLYQSDSEGKTTNKSELVKSNFSHFLAFLVFPRSLQHLKALIHHMLHLILKLLFNSLAPPWSAEVLSQGCIRDVWV